jgi:hypothetical protein
MNALVTSRGLTISFCSRFHIECGPTDKDIGNGAPRNFASVLLWLRKLGKNGRERSGRALE